MRSCIATAKGCLARAPSTARHSKNNRRARWSGAWHKRRPRSFLQSGEWSDLGRSLRHRFLDRLVGIARNSELAELRCLGNPGVVRLLGILRRVVHEPTKSAMRTAEACRVSGDRGCQAVVLHDEYGYILAILPASHQIRLDDLRRQLGLDVDLAAEYEIEELFDDCIPGAIPPVGECYGLETVVDERQPEVYLEGGDHATLVHMTHAQFASLTVTARHGSFSVHA